MTINSMPLNVSSPFSGLGTATFNVVTTGMYTCEVKSFLPYLASGINQSTSVANNIVDVTCAADTAGNKNSTYWTFNSAGNSHSYYVWYNINAAGVDPAVAGSTGIEVAGATGATAATLATATIAAIVASGAAAYVTASAGSSGHVILTNLQYGSVTAAANGVASYGASFSVTQAGSDGVPAASALVVKIKQGSTVLATLSNPSPTQQIMGGSVHIQATAADVITVVFSSISVADAALNAVKSIINLYQGE